MSATGRSQLVTPGYTRYDNGACSLRLNGVVRAACVARSRPS
jgi:hypothetical protein